MSSREVVQRGVGRGIAVWKSWKELEREKGGPVRVAQSMDKRVEREEERRQRERGGRRGS